MKLREKPTMTLKSQLFNIIYVILALLINRDWCKYQSIHLTSASTCTCCRPILNKLDAFSYLGSTLCSRFLVNLSNNLFEYLLKESHLKGQKKYKYYFLGFNRPRPGGETPLVVHLSGYNSSKTSELHSSDAANLSTK